MTRTMIDLSSSPSQSDSCARRPTSIYGSRTGLTRTRRCITRTTPDAQQLQNPQVIPGDVSWPCEKPGRHPATPDRCPYNSTPLSAPMQQSWVHSLRSRAAQLGLGKRVTNARICRHPLRGRFPSPARQHIWTLPPQPGADRPAASDPRLLRELQRLRDLLRQHGIEPDSGAPPGSPEGGPIRVVLPFAEERLP